MRVQTTNFIGTSVETSNKMKIINLLFLLIAILSCESDALFPDWLVDPIDWPAQVLKDSENLVIYCPL